MLAGLAIFAVLGFALFNADSKTGLVTAKQSQTLKFAYAVGPYNAIPIIALRKGFLAEEGFKIEEVRVSFIGYVFQQVSENQIDALVGAETPAVFAAMKGVKYEILATHEENLNDLVLVYRKDSGIKGISDLQGKKIGLPFTSVSHYNLWKNLIENNIDPAKVSLVDMAPQNMASALKHGDVDAIFTFEPVPSIIKQGLGEEVGQFTPPSKWMMNLYSSKTLANESKKKIINAFLKAEKFIKENKKEAIAIVAKENSLSEETLEKLWPLWDFHIKQFTGTKVMTEQANWAIQTKLVNASKVPDFSTMNNPLPLSQAVSEN